MHRVFEEYLHRLELAADKQQFREALKEFAAQFGLHSFAYLTLPGTTRQKMRAISTYDPVWVTHYFRHHYHRCDPIVGHARIAPAPFLWDPAIAAADQSGAVKRFFSEAADFDICYGYTVPLWEGVYPVAAVTFATDRRTREYRECIRRHDRLLEFAACCFHRQVRRRLTTRHVAEHRKLTERQQQCLELSAQGKSAVDIAQLLHIKPRTAVYHLENAKAKYGVRSITQAAISFRSSKEGH